MWRIEEHLAELSAVGRAPGTIRVKRCYLVNFAKVNPDPALVTEHDVVAELARHHAPETKKSCRSALHAYFLWSIKRRYLESDPSVMLDEVRVPRGVPRPCPDRVYLQALARADEDTRLMIMFGAYAGLRRAEIAGLHSDDIDGDVIRVLGKGGHRRTIAMCDALQVAMNGRPDGWVFPSIYGGHIEPDTVGHKVSRALGPGWSCHTLRHRFASRGYAGTHDLRAVQTALGHASPATTARYVATVDDAVRAVVAAAS